MKCRYCGYEMPEGDLYCRKCGEEMRIVPDYNPLEDMLTAQIKIGVSGENDRDYLQDIAGDRGRTASLQRRTGDAANRGRNTSAGRNTGRNASAGRNTGRNTSVGRNTGRNTSARRNTGRNAMDAEAAERERRRRQAERRREMLRKKRRRMILIILIFVIGIAAGCIAMYQNSYEGIVSHGYRSIKNEEYGVAEDYFNRAIAKNDKKADAYSGLAQVCVRQDKINDAVDMFDKVIAKQPGNVDIYEAYIEFCMNNGEEMLIPVLIDDAKESVQKKLSDYVIAKPEASLDDGKVYDDVQQLELSAGGNTIYYTTDKTEPTLSGIRYEKPIQLEEGENHIRAIAVDKRGIPSLPEEKTYVVEFPIEDAPAVSPSTGQYEDAQQIEIKIPEGYEAYYTMTGDDPTTASSKYTGPIEMPEGETLFKAILVSGSGRTSGITTRNYMLETDRE